MHFVVEIIERCDIQPSIFIPSRLELDDAEDSYTGAT
jgi:hypothetical protein